jgi:menaquinone-dependent protoporphyrinogen oxidase
MAKILLVYSTTDGHTRKICQRLQDVIEQQGHEVILLAVMEAREADLGSFDKIVIGASIRYGKHRPEVIDFINSNAEVLTAKPNAFFSVNVTARKPNKNTPETNPYMPKFLKKIHWQPRELAVFAGKIDYPRYSMFDRIMIRFIMWITKGPTDPNTVIEFTDWQAVEKFGDLINNME